MMVALGATMPALLINTSMPPKHCSRALDDRSPLAGVADVEIDDETLLRELGLDRHAIVVVHVGQHHVGTFGAEEPGLGQPLPSAGAGDQRDSASQLARHLVLAQPRAAVAPSPMRAGCAPVATPSSTVGVPATIVALKPALGRVYRH